MRPYERPPTSRRKEQPTALKDERESPPTRRILHHEDHGTSLLFRKTPCEVGGRRQRAVSWTPLVAEALVLAR